MIALVLAALAPWGVTLLGASLERRVRRRTESLVAASREAARPGDVEDQARR
jgi:hypothetical protein